MVRTTTSVERVRIDEGSVQLLEDGEEELLRFAGPRSRPLYVSSREDAQSVISACITYLDRTEA